MDHRTPANAESLSPQTKSENQAADKMRVDSDLQNLYGSEPSFETSLNLHSPPSESPAHTAESSTHPQSNHSEVPATSSQESSPSSAKPPESQQIAARPASANVERTPGAGPASPESSSSSAPAHPAESPGTQSHNPFMPSSQPAGPNVTAARPEAARAASEPQRTDNFSQRAESQLPPANVLGNVTHRETNSASAVAYKPQPMPADLVAPNRGASPQAFENRNAAIPREVAPARAARDPLESTLNEHNIRPVAASAPGEPRESWYAKKAQLAETANQVQKTSGAAATATLEGTPQSRSGPTGANPFINGPEHSDGRGGAGVNKLTQQTAPEHADSPAARLPDKTNGTRNPTEGVNDHIIADGKGGGIKVNSWLDEPEHSTRKPEIGQSGQIAYGGVTPDGRDHPFGLAGRMLEPKADNMKGQQPTGNIPDGGGRGPAGGRPDVGIIPQIFDGHGGGWRPNIKLPFGDKAEKETKEPGDHEEKDLKGGRKQTIAEFVAEKVRKQTNGDATAGDGKPIRRAIDGSILDATIMDGKAGMPTRRAADGSPLDATMMDVKQSRPPRRTADGALLDATMHEGANHPHKQTQTEVAEAFIGIIESVKGGILTGARLPIIDSRAATVKNDIGVNNSSPHAGELVLTGVKTKVAALSGDGTAAANTVAVLTPFLSGGGLRVSKNPGSSSVEFGQPHDQTVANTAISSAVAANVLSTAGGDALPVSLVNAKGEDQFTARILEEGRLKSRPSVNLHVPGGKYAIKGDAQNIDEIDTHGKEKDHSSDNKPKPYLTFGGGTSYADQNLTVEDMSIPPLPLAEFELAHAAAEAASERVKPTKAIDELEVTDQMSAKAREELQKRVRDDRYLYIVQDGDTIESVAATVLKAPQLAPLLFSLNRKYVLPEIMYGVHPLMVGVVLQLPTPSDILKFGQ